MASRRVLIFQRFTKISPQAMGSLTRGLRYLVSLQTLNFDFSKTHSLLTDVIMKSLAESSRSVTSLQNLSLKFPMGNNAGDASLMKGLSSLSSLKSFSLDFSG